MINSDQTKNLLSLKHLASLPEVPFECLRAKGQDFDNCPLL